MRTLSVMVDEQTDIFRISSGYYQFPTVGEPAPIDVEAAANLYFERRIRIPDEFPEIRAIFSALL